MCIRVAAIMFVQLIPEFGVGVGGADGVVRVIPVCWRELVCW